MGPPSRRSSAFPCGMPSMTSKRTTSPRPFKAQRCARVPPIMPAPMSAIFLRAMGLPARLRAGSLKSKKSGPCKSGGSPLEPPAREPELDRVERLGAHDLGITVGAREHPSLPRQPVDLHRPDERVDDPQGPDSLARVDAHLVRHVPTLARGAA